MKRRNDGIYEGFRGYKHGQPRIYLRFQNLQGLQQKGN